MAGLFFGFAFGDQRDRRCRCLGAWADRTSLEHVFQVCAYLPLMGIVAAFLPKLEPACALAPGSFRPGGDAGVDVAGGQVDRTGTQPGAKRRRCHSNPLTLRSR